MNLRIGFFITITFLLAITPNHSFSSDNPTFRFLRSDVSARAASLGGGLLTTPNDINAMFYNPATLGTLTQPQASFGFYQYIVDVSAGHASYGQEIPDIGFIGGGIVFTNYGDFTTTDINGIKLDQFSALDLSINGSFATKLNLEPTVGGNVLIGGSLKYISSSIANYSSSAFAIDIGGLYQFSNQRTAIALSILNMGTQISSYISTKEPLPSLIKLSFSHRPERLPVNLHITFNHLNADGNFSDKLQAFSLGGEFKVGQYLRLRFGYNNQRRQDLKISSGVGLAGFSLGGGIVYNNYTFDYGNLMYGDIGSQNYFTVGMQL